MSGHRKYVTSDECQKCNSVLTTDLKTIKNALIGEDLRGGLVAQVNDISAKLHDLTVKTCEESKQETKEKDLKRESSARWKIAVFTVGAGIVGIFIGFILPYLIH